MGPSHLKTLIIPERLIMCTVLEPFKKLDSFLLQWIPSKDRFMKYTGMDKRLSFWQEPKGNTQTGMHAHTETVETILVGQWEYVSAYYSLWFLVSTFLHSLWFLVSTFVEFIMRRMCCCRVLEVRYTNRRPLYLGATISWNSWRERGRTGEKCAKQFCALFFHLFLATVVLVF